MLEVQEILHSSESSPSVFAYIRVSTDLQTTKNQQADIKRAGYAVSNWVSEDGVSGTVPAMERKAFVGMMTLVKAGDKVIVTAVDRLGRDAEDILNTVNCFKKLKVQLIVLQFGNMDLTSSMGKMILSVMASMAELERNLLSERTKSGLERARIQGTKLGAPMKITPEMYRILYALKLRGKTMDEMHEASGVPRNSISRNIVRWGNRFDEYEKEYNERVTQYKDKK